MVLTLNAKWIVAILVLFLFGLAGSAAYTGFSVTDLQKPLDLFEGSEKSSPSDRIKDFNIKVFDDRIVIYIKDPYLARFVDTHSMEPIISKKSTGIELIPKSISNIKVGDIISYAPKNSNDTIIHRIIKTGSDSEGWYAITRGDNNNANDPEKVRFGQVKRVLVGVLY